MSPVSFVFANLHCCIGPAILPPHVLMYRSGSLDLIVLLVQSLCHTSSSLPIRNNMGVTFHHMRQARPQFHISSTFPHSSLFSCPYLKYFEAIRHNFLPSNVHPVYVVQKFAFVTPSEPQVRCYISQLLAHVTYSSRNGP